MPLPRLLSLSNPRPRFELVRAAPFTSTISTCPTATYMILLLCSGILRYIPGGYLGKWKSQPLLIFTCPRMSLYAFCAALQCEVLWEFLPGKMMELFSLVMNGAVTQGEGAHVGIEALSGQNRYPSESRESTLNCAMQGDVTIIRLNRRLKDDVIVLPRKMMELFNLVLEGAEDVVGKGAAHVPTEKTSIEQRRNPSESGAEAQVGETSKQSRNHSCRESSMTGGLKAGEAQVRETSKQYRNPSGRNVRSMVELYERCASDLKVTKGDQGEQALNSTMELVRRSPRKDPSVPGVQQHPDFTIFTVTTSTSPLDVAAQSTVAPPGLEKTTSTTKGEGEQSPSSTAELVGQYFVTPRKKPSVPSVQQHPDSMTTTNDILVAVAAKIAAPRPEAEATSITTKGEGNQALGSTVEMVGRPPCQKRTSSVPCVRQQPDVTPPTSGILAGAKSTAAPPPEEATSDASTRDIQQDTRRLRRKISSSVRKEIIQAADVPEQIIQPVASPVVQAVESASRILAESIDRIHSTKLRVAENKVKSQERLFNTELEYMKRRDRQINRNQKSLISAINGLTKIITTGIKNTESAGDAVRLGSHA